MCYIWTVEDVSKHFKGDSCSVLAISHSACYVIEAEHKLLLILILLIFYYKGR